MKYEFTWDEETADDFNFRLKTEPDIMMRPLRQADYSIELDAAELADWQDVEARYNAWQERFKARQHDAYKELFDRYRASGSGNDQRP